MRQEIRKRFTGPPRLWEAAVAVEDVRPYLLESGGRLRSLGFSARMTVNQGKNTGGWPVKVYNIWIRER